MSSGNAPTSPGSDGPRCDPSDDPFEHVALDFAKPTTEPPLDYRMERVGVRIQYFCEHGACGMGGGVKFWELQKLNVHRMVSHNLPFVQPHKRGRKHMGRRPPLSLERIRKYTKRRESNLEYVMRQHYNLQRRRVVDRVCQREGKTRYEELSRSGKREVEKEMLAYDSEERREARKERWLKAKERKDQLKPNNEGEREEGGATSGNIDTLAEDLDDDIPLSQLLERHRESPGRIHNWMAREKNTGKCKAVTMEEPKRCETFDSDTFEFKKYAGRPTLEDVCIEKEDETSTPLGMQLNIQLLSKKVDFYKSECERLTSEKLLLEQKVKELLDRVAKLSSSKMELEVDVQRLELLNKNWETMRDSNKIIAENQLNSFTSVLDINDRHKEEWKKLYMEAMGLFVENVAATPPKDNADN